MTLVAGFKCRDGFVIGADTEITYGTINFQRNKLYDFYGESAQYDLVIGGAGDGSYIATTAQKIRDAIKVLPTPTVESMKSEISEVVLEVHEKNLKYWNADSPNRPSVSLIIGVKTQDSDFAVLVVDRTSVSEVNVYECIGSGSELAEHLAEKMNAAGLSTAVTVHLVRQIFREVKGKGIYVGGNTEVIAVRAPTVFRPAEDFFELDLNKTDYRFLWGLDDTLLSAVRVSLDATKPDKNLDVRLREIRKRLRSLRADSRKSRSPGGTKLHLTEFGTEYGNPFKDM